MDDTRLKKMVALYEQGKTLEEVGRQFNITKQGVSLIFKKNKIPIRKIWGKLQLLPHPICSHCKKAPTQNRASKYCGAECRKKGRGASKVEIPAWVYTAAGFLHEGESYSRAVKIARDLDDPYEVQKVCRLLQSYMSRRATDLPVPSKNVRLRCRSCGVVTVEIPRAEAYSGNWKKCCDECLVT